MNVYDRIKKQASNRGWSLQDLADKAGLGTNSIYRWRTMNPKMDSLQAVADTLNVTVDYLLGNTDDPNPAPKGGKKAVVDLSQSNTFAYQGELYDADGIDPDDWDLIKAAFERAKKARRGK